MGNSLCTHRAKDIFSTQSLKYRLVIDGLWRRSTQTSNCKSPPLPSPLLLLIAKYYLIAVLPAPIPRKNMYLEDQEYIFTSLKLSQSAIFGVCRQLKVTVLHDLYLGSTSDTNSARSSHITCYSGSIILSVGGDIHIGPNCTISTECDREVDTEGIFIKCQNLCMSKGAKIRSFELRNYMNGSASTGKIHINIAQNLTIAEGADVWSGEVNISCGGSARIRLEKGPKGKANITAMNKVQMEIGGKLLLHKRSLCSFKPPELYQSRNGLFRRLQPANIEYVNGN